MADGQKPIPESKQEALGKLLDRAKEIPGAADAMAAYEDLQRSMTWRIVDAQGQVRSATGGNG